MGALVSAIAQMEGTMVIRPVLAAVIFTSLALGAAAASACPWNDASAGSSPSQVASSTPGSDSPQQVSKPN